MTKVLCDWCGKEIDNHHDIVNVMVQPTYGRKSDSWELCPEDADRVRGMANETVARQA